MGGESFKLDGGKALSACMFGLWGSESEYDGYLIYRHTVGTVWTVRLLVKRWRGHASSGLVGSDAQVYLAKVVGAVDGYGVSKWSGMRAKISALKAPKTLLAAFARARKLLVTMDAAQRLGAPV